MARIERLRIYPVKALDGEDREAVAVTAGGTLAGDRAYGLFGPDGNPVNGKRTDRVHDLATTVEDGVLTVRTDGTTRRFDLEGDVAAAEAWFSDFFDLPVTVRRAGETGFVDRPSAGPSVVATATLETVADWYGLGVGSVRRRLRTNVEVGGVPAFWTDRFAGGGGFTAGGVRLEGVEPCGRCVVPARDPDTGEAISGFRERFVERRPMPDWAAEDAFDHRYAAALIARVPEADRGGTLAVGDTVETDPARPAPDRR